MQRRRLLHFGVVACTLGTARYAASRQALAGAVPLQLLRTGDIGALPAIDLVLDGATTRWLVDSGSTTALVSPALAARLRLRHESAVRVATAGGVKTLERFTLPALPVPGDPQGPSSAVAMDLGALFGAAGAAVDGLLGAPWLRGHVTTFDFARGRLIWAPGTSAAPPGTVAIPLRWDGGLPVLRLAVGRRVPEDFLFDTGNAGALVFFARHAQALQADAATLPETMVRELGGTVRARYARIERLSAPGLVWREVPAALEADTAERRGGHFDRLAGSVGVALFEAGAVTLDDIAGRLTIDLPSLPEPPPLPGGFGLALSASADAGLHISAVIDGGPAAAAGMAAGDAVLAIDGASMRGRTPVDAWQTLTGHSAADFEVGRAEAAPRRIRLERRRFFPLLR